MQMGVIIPGFEQGFYTLWFMGMYTGGWRQGKEDQANRARDLELFCRNSFEERRLKQKDSYTKKFRPLG